MAPLRVQSIGDGLWRWECSTCGRRQIRTTYADALRVGLAHEHIPAPKEKHMNTATPDPKRPYKAYAAAAVAFLGLLWANLQGVEDWGSLNFQDWVTIVVPAVLTFGATYFVANPAARPVTQGHSPDVI